MYTCCSNENIQKLRTLILKSLTIELIYMFERNISAYGLSLFTKIFLITLFIYIVQFIYYIIYVCIAEKKKEKEKMCEWI